MWIIQLQYIDASGKNGGGIYINVDAIAAVRSVKAENEGQRSYWCYILMVDGTEYQIVNDLNDVLDDINRVLRSRNDKKHGAVPC